MATTTAKDTKWNLPDVPPWALILAMLVAPAGSGAAGVWAGGATSAQVDGLSSRVTVLEHQAASVQPVTERRLSEVESAIGRLDTRMERFGSNQIKICAALQVSCRE